MENMAGLNLEYVLRKETKMHLLYLQMAYFI